MRAGEVGAAAVCVLLAGLALAAAPAGAERVLQSEEVLQTDTSDPEKPVPPPDGQIEGACGIAVGPGGNLYVSDYHHGAVDIFDPDGKYLSQLLVTEAPEGPCGLALDSTGRLYANVWHQRAERLLPSALSIDNDDSTGIAVDPATDRLYVNDRTYVAAYESSGAPVLHEGQPLQIGLGSLADAYGVAAFGGRVYVADASDGTVKIFKPDEDPLAPIATVKGTPFGDFVSLADASLAVDPSNGHLLVVDDSQPGFIHPQAAVYEFKASGTFLDRLPGTPVHGEPSGIAVAGDGTLYVTDGNSEEANVLEYSPYGDPAPGPEAAPAPGGASQPLATAFTAASPGAGAGGSSVPAAPAKASRGQAELVQRGSIRIAVSGSLAPIRLPRDGVAPITVRIGGQITPLDPDRPPQLRKVTFAFNRAGRLDRRGLPQCGLSDIDPSNTQQALAACRSSLVGEGRFSAKVRLPEQSPFPSAGKMLAFNGNLEGRPVIFAHIYGRKPVPTSVVLPLRIRESRGTFGTLLDASLQELTGDWGYVTGIELTLGRKFSFKGERRSFLSAGCPAPKGFPGALFALAKTSFSFVGGRTLNATLTRSCKVR